MKTPLLFSGLALLSLMPACTSKPIYPVEVENPAIVYNNSGVLSVNKVELNDTATLLYMHSKFRPGYWIRFDTTTYLLTRGEKYPIKASDSFKIGEMFRMPASGEADFVLSFAPLPAATKAFDLIEDVPVEGAYRIIDILLTDVKSRIPKVHYHAGEKLIPSVISNQKAVLKGRIFGYRAEMGDEILSCSYFPYGCGGEASETKLKLDKKGRFNVELSPYFPMSVLTTFGKCYVAPGHTTELYYDLATKEIAFKGALAGINKDMFNQRVIDTEGELYFYTLDVNGMTGEQAYAHIDSLCFRHRDSLQAQKLETDASRILLDLLFKNSYLSYRKNLPTYCRVLEVAYKDGRLKQPYVSPDFKTTTYTEEGMPEFLQKLEDSPYFSYSGARSANPLATEAYYVEKLLLNIDKGKGISKEETAGLDTLSSPVYKELVEDHLTAYARLQEKMDSMENVHLRPFDELPNGELLARLLESYRGKPVLIDIWATWCAPCKSAMKTILPLKEKLKDQVHFVYLTGETSPLGDWQRMILDITGEHFYLSGGQYHFIMNKFKSQGVPTYLLFDANGRFHKKYIGYPGNEEMQKSLQELF